MLERLGDRLYIQLDLFDRDLIRGDPARVFASDQTSGWRDQLLADLLSPLVVEADGTVVPIRYGFPREYSLGNLTDAPLRELAGHWVAERYDAFREHCKRVFAAVTAPAELPFFNWYEIVASG